LLWQYLYEDWNGDLRLRLTQVDKTVASCEIPCTIDALGRRDMSLKWSVPSKPGDYVLAADLAAAGREPVCSVRDAKVVLAK